MNPLTRSAVLVVAVLILLVILELVRGLVFGYAPDLLSTIRSHLNALVIFFFVFLYFSYTRGKSRDS